MKLLQLPNNKVARFAINIALGWLWLPIATDFFIKLLKKAVPLSIICFSVIYLSIVIIPIGLLTRYIWWGRLKPRTRITRSKDD